jgi:hypothetical protein
MGTFRSKKSYETKAFFNDRVSDRNFNFNASLVGVGFPFDYGLLGQEWVILYLLPQRRNHPNSYDFRAGDSISRFRKQLYAHDHGRPARSWSV